MRRGVVLCGLLAAAPAVADDATDAAHAPGFVTLPLFDATSRVGVEGTYLRLAPDTFYRVEAHGQVVHSSGIGGYISVQSFRQEQYDNPPPGRFSLGLMYVARGSALGDPDLRFVAHAGVVWGSALPYALDTSGADTFGEEVGASLLARSDQFYGRLDLTGLLDGAQIRGAALGLGVGCQLGDVAIGAEAGYGPLRQHFPGTPFSITADITAALSVRYTGSALQPYGAVMTTLDVAQVAVTAGVEYRR